MDDAVEPVRAAGDVDAAWMTAVLRAAGIGTATAIDAIEAHPIGTGQVGDNVRFALTWRDPSAALPASVVGKFPSTNEASRRTAVHLGNYAREVGFYRDLRAEVAIRTPHVHHIGWEPASHDFVLVMEDIGGARQGDQLAGCTADDARAAIDGAAGLHAATWGRTADVRAPDWLGFPDAQRSQAVADLAQWAFPGFGRRYAGRLGADAMAIGAALVDRYPAWAARIAAWAGRNAWCVTHGDYRLDNMLFGANPSAPPLVVVDWQTVTVGIGPADVAYFCGAGLLPEVRADHERELVERYAAAVRRRGAVLDDAAAWDGYVLGSAGGYLMAVIASQLVERTERGDEMFAVMAERHAAQVESVGLLGLL